MTEQTFKELEKYIASVTRFCVATGNGLPWLKPMSDAVANRSANLLTALQNEKATK